MKPEEEAEIILWDWLKTKSEFVKEVYFNRINIINAPVFTTRGVNKKPDFLIKIDRGYGIEFIAVEVKPTTSSRNIHDSGKILNYYKNYIKEKTKYFINEEQIEINHFVVASNKSPEGKLFERDEEIICNGNSSDDHRKFVSLWNLFPEFEYQRTSDFIRRLWSEWRTLKKENNLNKNLPSIGVIISNPTKDNFPYLAIMNFNSHLTKPKWGQRFWKL